MEPDVKEITIFDKAGQLLLQITLDNLAYRARGYRTAMPSIVNKLGIIRAKVTQVNVKIERKIGEY